MRELNIQPEQQSQNSRVDQYFHQRLTLFDSSIQYSVMPYGEDNNIDEFKALFDIWTFGEEIDKMQNTIDDLNHEKTITRTDEIELIRQSLEDNGF